jgi:hypothetical protein
MNGWSSPKLCYPSSIPLNPYTKGFLLSVSDCGKEAWIIDHVTRSQRMSRAKRALEQNKRFRAMSSDTEDMIELIEPSVAEI